MIPEPSGTAFHTLLNEGISEFLNTTTHVNIFKAVMLIELFYGSFPQFNIKLCMKALIPKTNKAFSFWSKAAT